MPGKWPTPNKGLWTLLTESEDSAAVVQKIAATPALRAEVEALLPALEAAKEPANKVEFAAIMARQKVVFGLGNWEAAEWTTATRVYYEALEGYSADIIEDAFLRWNRGEGMKDPAMGQFFPKPSQLVALAARSKAELLTAAYRARRAVEHVEKAPREISAEERAQVAEGLRELARTFRGRALPTLRKPSISPQEMAERIRAQAPPEPSDDPGIVL
jgi:hypothetical protein